MKSYRTKALLVAVAGLLAATASVLGTPPPAGAQGDGEAHFHGGRIVVGDDAVVVDLVDCAEGTDPDGSVLFLLEVDGGEATGTFHCSDVPATGPLGNAVVDLLCDVTWQWPVASSTHLALGCLQHIFIETVLGDLLCSIHGSLTPLVGTPQGCSLKFPTLGGLESRCLLLR